MKKAAKGDLPKHLPIKELEDFIELCLVLIAQCGGHMGRGIGAGGEINLNKNKS